MHTEMPRLGNLTKLSAVFLFKPALFLEKLTLLTGEHLEYLSGRGCSYPVRNNKQQKLVRTLNLFTAVGEREFTNIY